MKEVLTLNEENLSLGNERRKAVSVLAARRLMGRLGEFFAGAFNEPTNMSHLAKEKWLLQKYAFEEVQKKVQMNKVKENQA